MLRAVLVTATLAMAAWLAASALAAPRVLIPAPATPPGSLAAPAQLTGNLLVLLKPRIASAAAVSARMATAGAQPAGRSVPQIGLITVRPPRGVSAVAFAQRLLRVPGVGSVQLEHRYVPRAAPNDPALTVQDPSDPGVVWQWYLLREDFPAAWSLTRGNGALVGVIDTGIDASHPDLSPKLAVPPINQQPGDDNTGPASTDQVGHGTHVASLACADTNNGLGMAGAGYDCGLVIEKTDFSDSSIASAIVDATNRHVGAINMSFGPSMPTPSPAPASEVRALNYAVSKKVVLVAAAADSPGTEQGDPANVLQPAGTGPSINKGIGLDVTAADYSGHRASFAGSGTEISLAAFGAFTTAQTIPCTGQPLGIFGAYPGNATDLEQFPPGACRVDLNGDNRYATVAGTSMAAPQVAATGALMRKLNPFASLQDILRTIKQTAQRPAGHGWSSDLGWGILDAGAALGAIRRLDRLAPVAHLFAPKVSRRRIFKLNWSGHDQRFPGLVASGIADYLVFVSSPGHRRHRIARTRKHTLTFHGRRGVRYTFSLVAVDHAGNHERRPARASTRVTRRAR